MNVLQIVNYVLRRVDEDPVDTIVGTSSEPVVELIKQYVNEVIFEIFNYTHEWRWRERSSTISVVAGTSTYDIPTSISNIAIDSLKVVKNGSEPMNYVSYEVYQGIEDTSELAEEDQLYTIYNDDFIFLVTPTTSSTLTLSYQLAPSILAAPDEESSLDDVVPTIPVEYHWVIVNGVEAKIKEELKNMDSATFAYKRYQEGLRTMKLNNRNFYQKVDSFYLDPAFNNMV